METAKRPASISVKEAQDLIKLNCDALVINHEYEIAGSVLDLEQGEGEDKDALLVQLVDTRVFRRLLEDSMRPQTLTLALFSPWKESLESAISKGFYLSIKGACFNSTGTRLTLDSSCEKAYIRAVNSKELYLGLPGQTLSFDQSAAGVKLDYTQTCGFKTFYEYTLLSEMEPWKTEVSFYGYVITADEPSPTKGEHWKMCIKITDRTLLERAKARGISSWPMITVIVFANGEENAFPRNLTTWDIIRCHRASVQMFDNRLQIMLSPKFHSAFTCFSGDPNSSIEAIFSSSKKYTWTEFDSEVISHMRQQRVIMQNMLRSVHDMDNSIAVRQAPRARTMYCLSDNAIPELHFSTIKCIKRHSSPIMLFKARVKVVDYFPKNIEDFVKVFCTRCRRSSTSMDGSPCPSCNSVDYIQLHLVLMFRLQDTSGDLLCILQGKAADEFFCSINARTISVQMGKMADILDRLTQPNSYIECGIKSYVQECSDPFNIQTPRFYQIFGTRLKNS